MFTISIFSLSHLWYNMDNKIFSELGALYNSAFGSQVRSCIPIAGGGGNRRYYRLSAPASPVVVGVVGDSVAENRCFISLSRIFRNNGIPVPEIFAVSDDKLYYLEEDLGDTSLFSMLGSKDAERLVEDSLLNLVRMQSVPSAEWKDAVTSAPFSRRQVFWDLNYFKYEFLKADGVDFNEETLEDDFGRFADSLLSSDVPMGFMFRDFQSRNVMVRDEKVYFIDFQGGRLGPCIYDAVSFLWQARAGFSDSFRRRMISLYAGKLAEAMPGVSADSLLRSVSRFALFRTLQVLGAYGFRGLVEKRAHFIQSIPQALENLRTLLDEDAAADMPELERVCRELCNSERFLPSAHEGLLIKVFSFSYKRGYPEDLTGNGGGFMFDCRGMHNPGRYDEFKPLTGRDKPVIDFLKDRGEAEPFADSALEIVSPAVECYLRRGFNDLQIGFGCTGGRHRSVFCAERLAHALKDKYPQAQVMLIHREQGIMETL